MILLLVSSSLLSDVEGQNKKREKREGKKMEMVKERKDTT